MTLKNQLKQKIYDSRFRNIPEGEEEQFLEYEAERELRELADKGNEEAIKELSRRAW